jgi:two-component system, OmpR family, phosphate regulon sensor histidine kinase PhoR
MSEPVEAVASMPIGELRQFRDESIAHLIQELRNPLTNIKTALKLLESPALKVPQRQRYIDLIKSECDRQNALMGRTSDLLALNDESIDDRIVTATKLPEMILGIVSMYQPLAAEQEISLVYQFSPHISAVACREIWLRQIITNLIDNGIKYTHAGGKVSVVVWEEKTDIHLEVRDTGIGIQMSDLPKIFDRFYQVRNSSIAATNSAGLGLTIVKHLLSCCGGSISVSSQVDRGSTFRVLLPKGNL